MNRRIFVDMDGVVALFEPSSLEEMTSPGFFLSRKPVPSVIKMVSMLQEDDEIEVYILSSYLLPISKEEKIAWNEKYTSIPQDHQLYVPYGTDKCNYLEQEVGMMPDDMLLDDFTPNLKTWKGVGVKIYNGINGNHGTWTGYSIHSNMEPGLMYNQINAISKLCHQRAVELANEIRLCEGDRNNVHIRRKKR